MTAAAAPVLDAVGQIISFAGEELILHPSGVVFLPRHSTLVVSDLHLEKGAAFARRRLHLPPWDTPATLARLARTIDLYAPRRIVSLGDSFHDREGAAALPEAFRTILTAMIGRREWIWIAGNHDPDPPAGLPGETTEEFRLGELHFRHEPKPGRTAGEIAGHLHPAARIVVRGQSVRRPCFVEDGQRLVMPAFGAYTGAVDIASPHAAHFFDWPRLTAFMIGRDRLYAIPGRNLSRR